MKVVQSCLTLCDPMDCIILQARILEWVAVPFSRGSSWPRNRTWVSCIAGRFFTNWAIREALLYTNYIFYTHPWTYTYKHIYLTLYRKKKSLSPNFPKIVKYYLCLKYRYISTLSLTYNIYFIFPILLLVYTFGIHKIVNNITMNAFLISQAMQSISC